MPDHYRHKLSELITRYELEPQLRDVYVEGQRDHFFLRWFFQNISKSNVVIYPILDAVDAGELLQNGAEGGNRARVIELCERLSAGLPANRRNVRGLIDKDYSSLLGGIPEGPLLLVTEFSCLECYSLNDETLHKFSNVYLGMEIPSACFQAIFAILKELFLLRTAKIALGHSSWVEGFTKLCSIQRGQVVFDSNEFTKRLVNASGGQLNEVDFRNRVEQLRQMADSDFRQYINAHHLITLLSWYARQLGVHAHVCNERPLQRALLTSVEAATLTLTALFSGLAEWADASVSAISAC